MVEDEEENFDPYLEELRYNKQATMNPLYSIRQQRNYSHYLPDEYPANTGNGKIRMIKPQPMVKVYDDLHTSPYIDRRGKTRSCYGGIHRQYDNLSPYTYEHPFGWSTDFNHHTAGFANRATDLNKRVVSMYQQLADTDIQQMNFGPDHLDSVIEIDSPFLE